MMPKKYSLFLSIKMAMAIYLALLKRVLQSQKTDRVYQTFIVVYKTSGDIYYATCTCTAVGGSCNHVAAICFAIDAHDRTLPTYPYPFMHIPSVQMECT